MLDMLRPIVAVAEAMPRLSSQASAFSDSFEELRCVGIGAGVRLPPRGLALFEVVINAVHKATPGAAIAFNTRVNQRSGKSGINIVPCIVRSGNSNDWY